MSRWYDAEPTLSMAISLLQSAPMAQQQAVVGDALAYLQEWLPEEDCPGASSDAVVFFNRFRLGWSPELFQFVACLKELSFEHRQEMALWVLDHLVHVDRQHCAEQQQRVGRL